MIQCKEKSRKGNNMCKNRPIKIKYFDNGIDKISKIEKGDWIVLRATETVELKPGDYALIPLG